MIQLITLDLGMHASHLMATIYFSLESLGLIAFVTFLL